MTDAEGLGSYEPGSDALRPRCGGCGNAGVWAGSLHPLVACPLCGGDGWVDKEKDAEWTGAQATPERT